MYSFQQLEQQVNWWQCKKMPLMFIRDFIYCSKGGPFGQSAIAWIRIKPHQCRKTRCIDRYGKIGGQLKRKNYLDLCFSMFPRAIVRSKLGLHRPIMECILCHCPDANVKLVIPSGERQTWAWLGLSIDLMKQANAFHPGRKLMRAFDDSNRKCYSLTSYIKQSAYLKF